VSVNKDGFISIITEMDEDHVSLFLSNLEEYMVQDDDEDEDENENQNEDEDTNQLVTKGAEEEYVNHGATIVQHDDVSIASMLERRKKIDKSSNNDGERNYKERIADMTNEIAELKGSLKTTQEDRELNDIELNDQIKKLQFLITSVKDHQNDNSKPRQKELDLEEERLRLINNNMDMKYQISSLESKIEEKSIEINNAEKAKMEERHFKQVRK